MTNNKEDDVTTLVVQPIVKRPWTPEALESVIEQRPLLEPPLLFEPATKPPTAETLPVTPLLVPSPLHRDPLIGTVLGNKYEILDIIGRGGMSTVYRARESGLLHRDVAIKILQSDLSLNKSAMARVLQEARIIGAIQHPNVVHLLDAERIEPGSVYIVMELLHGRTLADIIGEMKAQDTVFSWEKLAPIMLQICEGLRAVHQLGFVHRDMKPSNCFCIDLGHGRWHMKVLDFGISKVMDRERQTLAETTNDQMFVGTPHYAAPEMTRGSGQIDHRADIYAIGVMLYLCLTGSLPFHGTNPVEILYRAAHERPVPPSIRRAGISSSLDALIMRAMEIDPENRHPTIVDLIDEIRCISGSTESAILEISPGSHTPAGATPDPLDTTQSVGTAPDPTNSGAKVFLPVPVSRPVQPPRFARLITFAVSSAQSARSLMALLIRRMTRRDQRTKIGFWRANDPGRSGVFQSSYGPWLPIEALLSEHEFECSHEEARYIVSFLAESFYRFRKIDKQTLQLDFEDSASSTTTVRWEHYCIIVTNEFSAASARLGTTFVERLVNIEPLLHAIRKNVRKTVLIITRSDRIGRGVFDKVDHYRSELDVYMVPILVARIIEVHRNKAGAMQSHLVREFNRLHPIESRLAPDGPLTEAADLAGFTRAIEHGSRHLQKDPSIFIISGAPLSGKTSIINAICAELELGRPSIELFTPVTRVEAPRPATRGRSKPPGMTVLDNINSRDVPSQHLSQRIAANLDVGQKVVLTSIRVSAHLLDLVRRAAPPGTEIDCVSVRPLGDPDFKDFAWAQCVRRNIRLDPGAIKLLFKLSGGFVGFASSVLNHAMRAVFNTSPQQQNLASRVNVLRPIVIGPSELRNGAAALVTSATLFSTLSTHFSAVELAVMQALAPAPLSAARLTAKLSEFPATAVRTALLELYSLHLVNSTNKNWGGISYGLRVEAFRYWIDGLSECQPEYSNVTPPPTTPQPTPAPSAPATPDTRPSTKPDRSPMEQANTTQFYRGNTGDLSMRANKLLELNALLVSLFNDNEFRLFLRCLEGGDILINEIPGHSDSFTSTVSKAVDVMFRNGYVDSAFFQALVCKFHRRQSDIDKVAQLWGFGQTTRRGEGRDGTMILDRFNAEPEGPFLFISYASDDWSDVQKLAGKFHRVGFNAILDAWESDDDGNARGRLRADLRRSLPGIIILSSRSLSHGWAIQLLTETLASLDSSRVVPVLIQGAVPPESLALDGCVIIRNIDRCDDDLKHLAKVLRR